MTVVGLWLRAELRRRWRPLLALAVLVGLAGAAVLTAVAGAGRSDRAYRRFLDAHDAPDVELQMEAAPPDDVLAAIGRLSQVEIGGGGRAMFVQPAGGDLVAGLEFVAFAAVDRQWGREVEGFRLLSGRVPRADAADELLINEQAADDLDLDVGDRLALASYTPEQMTEIFLEGAVTTRPAGPDLSLDVVGIGRGRFDVGQGPNAGPLGILPLGFVEAYGDRIGSPGFIYSAMLHGGEGDIPGFTEAVSDLMGGEPVTAVPRSNYQQAVEDALDVHVVALLAVAGGAAVAGLVLVGQAVGRQVAAAGPAQESLRAIGTTRPQRAAMVLAPMAVVAVAGAALSAVVSVAASALLPVGLAARAEPDPGLAFDGLVTGLGVVAVVALVLAGGAVAAWRVSRGTEDRAGTKAPRRPSVVGRWAAHAGVPPAGVTGVRMALEPGGGRGAVPVRPALVGAVGGVVGVVAVLTFGASLDRLLETPELYGSGWDAEVSGGESAEVVAAGRDDLVTDAEVEALATATVSEALVGDETVQAFGLESHKGAILLTVVAGRSPAGPDEVVLGPRTADRLGVGVGDRVTIEVDGRPHPAEMVGEALLPTTGSDDYREGVGLTRGGFDRLGFEGAVEALLVRWEPGVDEDARLRRLNEEVGLAFPAEPPAEVANLEEVRGFPAVLAAFLVVLALAAIGHALIGSVRRRSRELAVLRSVGFVRRQIVGAVAAQATTLVVVGVVVGIPVGVAVGRWAWTVVADGLAVAVRPVVPGLAVLLLVPAALGLVNLLASLPARAAARTRPATVLRAE